MLKYLRNAVYNCIGQQLISWRYCHNSRVIRLTILAIYFIATFMVISWKLLYLASVAREDRRVYAPYVKPRKEIVDRNGDLLAVNIPVSSLFANPKHIVDIDNDIKKLHSVLPEIDISKLRAELKSDKTFCWIKRDITPKEEQKINDLGIAGFYFEKENKRMYTHGKLLSHVIGYVGRDGEGLAGLEKRYNDFLSHKHDKNTQDSDNSLRLTLDTRLQNIVAEEISVAMEKFGAVAGVGIVVEVNSGDVLSMVSLPSFNPHDVSHATEDELFNRATLALYDTGSSFKSITFAIGFDTNIVTLHDAYNLTNLRVANFNLKDVHKAEGWHSVAEAFMHSSNIATAQIALEVGAQKFKSYISKLGMLERLNIDLPETSIPLYPRKAHWDDLSLATMSYGYTLSISPLQLTQAMLPVVNGGYLKHIKLVKNNSDSNDDHREERVFSNSTSVAMRKLMRLVVSHGSGKKANVPGYFVGGKTGTAEVQVGKNYVRNQRRAGFFAILPAMDPKYAVYVMLDRPKGIKETFGFAGGGWTAAPTAGSIISRMIALYGIEPYDENDASIQEALHVDYKIDSNI